MNEKGESTNADTIKRWREILTKDGAHLLKGERIELNTDWERLIAAHMALSLLTEMTYKNMSELSNQIAEDFDHKFDKHETIPLTPDAKKNIMLYIKIKNDCHLIDGFYEKAERLQAYSLKLDAAQLPEGVHRTYITSFATFKELAVSIKKMEIAITADLPVCFAEAEKKDGFDLKAFEAEVMRGVSVNAEAEQKLKLLEAAVADLKVKW